MASRTGEPGRPGPAFLSPAAIARSRLIAWSLALACLYSKCVTGFDPFPYWGSDPTRVVLPITSLTPAPSMALDAAALIACSVALLAEVLSGADLRRWLLPRTRRDWCNARNLRHRAERSCCARDGSARAGRVAAVPGATPWRP